LKRRFFSRKIFLSLSLPRIFTGRTEKTLSDKRVSPPRRKNSPPGKVSAVDISETKFFTQEKLPGLSRFFSLASSTSPSVGFQVLRNPLFCRPQAFTGLFDITTRPWIYDQNKINGSTPFGFAVTHREKTVVSTRKKTASSISVVPFYTAPNEHINLSLPLNENGCRNYWSRKNLNPSRLTAHDLLAFQSYFN
jgi:hypothetical protein